MQWVYCADQTQAVADLTERLRRELQAGHSVVWLLSGGSNVAISVQIMQQLPDDLTRNLTVSLVDERYGVPGHADSNWTKLEQAGFPVKRAELRPILTANLDFEATARHFETILNHSLVPGRVVIAQLGIGDDGHIAGILPQSLGTDDRPGMVIAYRSDPYDRISMTFEALRCVTAAYTMAFGASKHEPLTTLASRQLPLADQPAQILRQLHEAYVYNDQVKETS